MSASNSIVVSRIESAAEVLRCPKKDLTAYLERNGITETDVGLKLLNASTTTFDDLKDIIWDLGPSAIAVKAAVSILKGSEDNVPVLKIDKDPGASEPYSYDPAASGSYNFTIPTVFHNGSENTVTATAGATSANITVSPSSTEAFVRYLRDSRPIQQLKDRELLELYIAERDYEVEQELHRRARYQHFIILQNGKHEPGKEVIDVEASMDLLRSSRRRTNPAMIPMGDTVVPVYRITELNPEGRLVELCPICGDILYKGYCEKCELNFQGVGDHERAYARLVVDSGKFKKDSHSDRLALWRSASKGIKDMRKTWPSIQKVFDERKLTGDLPKLRVMENRPSSQVADPFHVAGNRTY